MLVYHNLEIITRLDLEDGKTIPRVVGQVPKDTELTSVEPTLEDAYLLVMHRVPY
ncbi:MAG: hypothetical protein AB2L21_02405 [Anaerolineaceae bacterium]|jgi:hypothetical protein